MNLLKAKSFYKNVNPLTERGVILAHRKLSLKYHPDKNTTKPEHEQQENTETFKKITEAKDLLIYYIKNGRVPPQNSRSTNSYTDPKRKKDDSFFDSVKKSFIHFKKLFSDCFWTPFCKFVIDFKDHTRKNNDNHEYFPFQKEIFKTSKTILDNLKKTLKVQLHNIYIKITSYKKINHFTRSLSYFYKNIKKEYQKDPLRTLLKALTLLLLCILHLINPAFIFLTLILSHSLHHVYVDHFDDFEKGYLIILCFEGTYFLFVHYLLGPLPTYLTPYLINPQFEILLTALIATINSIVLHKDSPLQWDEYCFHKTDYQLLLASMLIAFPAKNILIALTAVYMSFPVAQIYLSMNVLSILIQSPGFYFLSFYCYSLPHIYKFFINKVFKLVSPYRVLYNIVDHIDDKIHYLIGLPAYILSNLFSELSNTLHFSKLNFSSKAVIESIAFVSLCSFWSMFLPLFNPSSLITIPNVMRHINVSYFLVLETLSYLSIACFSVNTLYKTSTFSCDYVYKKSCDFFKPSNKSKDPTAPKSPQTFNTKHSPKISPYKCYKTSKK